jgi:hypothetical protein
MSAVELAAAAAAGSQAFDADAGPVQTINEDVRAMLVVDFRDRDQAGRRGSRKSGQ